MDDPDLMGHGPTLSLKEIDYVEAVKASGGGRLRIMFAVMAFNMVGDGLRDAPPVYKDLGDEHFVACHLAESLHLRPIREGD